MLTTNNGSTSPCSNISSNCVVWQGPDIPCIGLCDGDTVSDVIAKLATELCDILDQTVTAEPDLSGLNLACTLPQGQTAPDTLTGTIQLIINHVCSIQGTEALELPVLNLPPCLYYDTTEGLVSSLRLDLYAVYLANQICNILSSISVIELTITNHESRLVILENCILPCSPQTPMEIQVISSCVLSGGGLIPLSQLVLALETRFCSLENAVGAPALISNAINSTSITAGFKKLSTAGTYGNDSFWISNPSSLAHSVQNAWSVIYDLYNSIQDIQLNCCPGACDSIVYSYTTSVNADALGIPISISLLFNGASAPSGYLDCGGSTSAIVTDSNGLTVSTVFSFSTIAGTLNAVNLSLTGLNVYDNLNIGVAFCLTDGVNTCNETINKTVNLSVPCPTDIQVVNIGTDDITVTFTNNLGATASYIINVINANTGLVVATRNITSPPASISEVFSGLTGNTPYIIRVTSQINGKQSVCLDVPFNTLVLETSCADGIDVAIIMDYTASMGVHIDATKAGATSLISYVDGLVGANVYRLGLAIVDEVTNGGHLSYGGNVEYTSLPAAQKYVNTTGAPNSDIYITAMEMFADNNAVGYETQIDKLNGTIPLGDGVDTPDPMDKALDLVVNQNFLGTYRAGVAKYAILITDSQPSGLDDAYNAPGENDDLFINNLKAICITQGIKVIVLGQGASNAIYQSLATDTGGNFNTQVNDTIIQNAIQIAC